MKEKSAHLTHRHRGVVICIFLLHRCQFTLGHHSALFGGGRYKRRDDFLSSFRHLNQEPTEIKMPCIIVIFKNMWFIQPQLGLLIKVKFSTHWEALSCHHNQLVILLHSLIGDESILRILLHSLVLKLIAFYSIRSMYIWEI